MKWSKRKQRIMAVGIATAILMNSISLYAAENNSKKEKDNITYETENMLLEETSEIGEVSQVDDSPILEGRTIKYGCHEADRKQYRDLSKQCKNERFFEEKQQIKEVLKTKNPLVKEYLNVFLDAEKRTYSLNGIKEVENQEMVHEEDGLGSL